MRGSGGKKKYNKRITASHLLCAGLLARKRNNPHDIQAFVRGFPTACPLPLRLGDAKAQLPPALGPKTKLNGLDIGGLNFPRKVKKGAESTHITRFVTTDDDNNNNDRQQLTYGTRSENLAS